MLLMHRCVLVLLLNLDLIDLRMLSKVSYKSLHVAVTMAEDTAPAKRAKIARRGLKERLEAGEHVLCAEGYLLALCRRGYVATGVWVPEFLIDHPEVLRSLHYEFIHAGSDVTEAYQYATHRQGLNLIGKEDKVEEYNQVALQIAREVSEDTGTLFAGGISKTDLFDDESIADPTSEIRAMFEEQVHWAKEAGVDYIIGETFIHYREAEIALEVIKSFDLPAVITFTVLGRNSDGVFATPDGVPITKACQQLLEKGATLVGTNCFRGPDTMMEVVREIIKVVPPEKVCALPIAYRTSKEEPTFRVLTDKVCPENNPVYPHGLSAFYVSEREIAKFTKTCVDLGLKYMGICCGNTGNYMRTMAEAMGRTTMLSKYHDPEKVSKIVKSKQELYGKQQEQVEN